MAPGMHSVPRGEAVGQADADVSAVASLDEPTRRRIYDQVGAHALPVSREEVAAELDVPLRTAAFHLDRLADLGLLSVSFARRSGRSGPGAGRPAKLYERSAREVSVSLPPRHYDIAGRLLAGALAQAQQSGEPPRVVLDREAHAFGQAMARELFGSAAGHPSGRGDTGDTGDLIGLLKDHGFEPGFSDGDILLRNCPFHALAQEHTELVCGMNLHLLEGVLEGLGGTGLRARLDPGISRCCVRLEPADQE
ncbi:MAG TPA: helix-turn-helix domain-containing protein [Dermatophilaceae bacterium]